MRSVMRRGMAVVALAVGAVALPLMLAGPAFAATDAVSDGGFATPAVTSTGGYDRYCLVAETYCGGTASPSIGPWTVTQGSVDVYGSAFYAPPSGDPSSTQTVDLDGIEPGGISQPLALTAGDYLVSFEVNGNLAGCGATTKSFTYGVGANPAGTYTYDTTTQSGWALYSFPVSIPASNTYPIFFTSDSDAGSDCGAVITDVSVVPITGTPLADPAIAAGGGMLAAAVFGFVVIRRRRRTAASS